MKNIMNLVWKLQIWKDTRGQDLIEYALMAGFVAVAAGAIMPAVAHSISAIFEKIVSVTTPTPIIVPAVETAGTGMMDSSMIRIACAVLAALFLGLIVMRRKKSIDE